MRLRLGDGQTKGHLLSRSHIVSSTHCLTLCWSNKKAWRLEERAVIPRRHCLLSLSELSTLKVLLYRHEKILAGQYVDAPINVLFLCSMNWRRMIMPCCHIRRQRQGREAWLRESICSRNVQTDTGGLKNDAVRGRVPRSRLWLASSGAKEVVESSTGESRWSKRTIDFVKRFKMKSASVGYLYNVWFGWCMQFSDPGWWICRCIYWCSQCMLPHQLFHPSEA